MTQLERRTVSGLMLTLLVMSMLTLAFNIQPVRASGTIYIKSDGSIDPPLAPIQRDGDLYTFTDDIYDEIVVEKDNIVVDGAGYTLQGTGAKYSRGISLSGTDNVTIRNMKFYYFYYHILLNRCSNIVISENTIRNTVELGYGIYLNSSTNNLVSGNNLWPWNSWWPLYGIQLYNSSNNIVSENDVYNDWWAGIRLEYSSNNTMSGNNIRNNEYGIMLSFSSNNTISGNTITQASVFHCGISGFDSNFNNISGNHIADNYDGIGLEYSSNNTISENNITDNDRAGIGSSFSSDYNSISGNMIANNEYGIWLYGRESLVGPSYNIIKVNNITGNNLYGIWLRESSSNIIYHNNFVDNAEQVDSEGSTNVWDDDYPSGGNYWSDYTTRYPDAQELDGSGIWDTPYVIDENNQDNYPLMERWTPPPLIPRNIDELKTEIEKCWQEGEIDNQGIVRSLIAKLNVAQKLVDKGKIDEAKGILEEDFIPQVQNLSGIHITLEVADILIKSAEYILSNL